MQCLVLDLKPIVWGCLSAIDTRDTCAVLALRDLVCFAADVGLGHESEYDEASAKSYLIYNGVNADMIAQMVCNVSQSVRYIFYNNTLPESRDSSVRRFEIDVHNNLTIYFGDR